MSIRAHVRKLRPIKESYTPPVEKVQSFLSEAKSTASSDAGSISYLLTRDPTKRPTIATGPKANVILLPISAYDAQGSTEAYRPLIGG